MPQDSHSIAKEDQDVEDLSPLVNPDTSNKTDPTTNFSPSIPVHTMWPHKRDLQPISHEEQDFFQEKLMQ